MLHFGKNPGTRVQRSPSFSLLAAVVARQRSVFDGNLQLSLQLQSNLIPGLNLNALGLFPSGSPGMGPSMSSVPPPGAHGGCSFGVSCSPRRDTPLTRSASRVRLPVRMTVLIAELLREPGEQIAVATTPQSSPEFHVCFFL